VHALDACNVYFAVIVIAVIVLFKQLLLLGKMSVDRDEDGIITKEEFIALPRGDVDDMMHGEESDAIWLKERRKEFEDVIDLDHDGKVGIEELKVVFYGSYRK